MLRLRQIALVAEKITPVVDALRDVFALDVAYRDPSVAMWGLENALLPVGGQFLEVVAPTQSGTAAGRYLERRGGDGGYMVILQTDEQGVYRRAAAGLGVRTAFEHDLGDYRIWQLHPRDTGGAFLEIDEQDGGEDPNGPWHPAGRDWQKAVRTDALSAIRAAEIQSHEPEALAKRWATILGRPVEREDGRSVIRLDNAALHFVTDEDGRGEGLGGVDLLATDRRRIGEAATQRGAKLDGDLLLLGGVRFRLLS